MAEKPDPFDVAPLERSLNDSATRVSTIWISYLVFALYLLTATGTATHRQLFLGEPLKLPVLNIDLPLFWFSVLAPILFVLFHLYVLVQVLLLGRTAAAYNGTINRAFGPTPENALMRQRLANTLFAQIFAGSPREREGWLGWLLHAMAWITLALAPIYIILAFQIAFLPYHSHLATWTHRLLLLIELAVAFVLWPVVVDARKDFSWRRLWRRVERTAVIPIRLLSAKKERRWEWQRLRLQAVPIAACTSFVAISLGLASFPGEPHVNLLTGNSPFAVRCDRWIPDRWISRSFDRLVLPGVVVVDDEKLGKIEKATAAKGQRPSEGERTRSFRERDLTCGTFDSADLRRADFAGARMSGASFEFTLLQGASLSRAQLQGASLFEAQLQSADLKSAQLQGAGLFAAHLQGAYLNDAQLQGATLWGAQLQGANLWSAQLQGAELLDAHLQGAYLHDAQLQGASLHNAHLQGASLSGAQLQGAYLYFVELQDADLVRAQLQGADLNHAELQRADLTGAQLQGATLSDSQLTLANLRGVYLWRARDANCSSARVNSPKFQVAFGTSDWTENPATPEAIKMFIEGVVAQVGGPKKDEVRKRLKEGLVATIQKDDLAIETKWRDCASNSEKFQEPEYVYLKQHADFLRDLACNAPFYRNEIAEGIARNWIWESTASVRNRDDFSSRLARGLLGLDGKQCAATKDLTEETKGLLGERASPPTPAN